MSPIRMSRLESAMRVVLEFHEAFKRADTDSLQEMMTEDCILESAHPAPEGTRFTGRESIVSYWQEFFHRSSQVHIDIEDIFGAGSHCIMRWRCQWVDPEQGEKSLRGVDLFLVRGGAIHEIFSYAKS